MTGNLELKEILTFIMNIAGLTKFLEGSQVPIDQIQRLKAFSEDRNSRMFSLTQVIGRQERKLGKVAAYLEAGGQTGDEITVKIKECLARLPFHRCGICGITGHSNSYCWINGQIYADCRTLGPDYQEANVVWRQAIKTRNLVRQERLRQALNESQIS